ncbi:MAG TPA: sodium-independent anion transporter [Morganella sp. (in: Bacteria)]|nr:sodium-independent anion transporter [Morganella sp. (in: enterobacteria)]
MPGLSVFLHYERKNLRYDIRAGLSVAAVALPVAIAYTGLMGINAIVGLYACILPMVTYALFGSSRQLIVGPDAATCAVIAAAIIPLAKGDPDTLWQLAIIMTLMTGVWCLIAGHFKLAAFADFLSQPILQGLLNGVAATIIAGQIGNVLGVSGLPSPLIERLFALPGKLHLVHFPTLLLTAVSLAALLLLGKIRRNWPGPLIVMTIATLVSAGLDFSTMGIAVVGNLGDGLPYIKMLAFDPGLLRELVIPSLNLAVISIVSFMMTVRSFAEKNGYAIDVDQELRAQGYINIASGLSQGFAVSAATSRTAVNDASGGKTQMVSLVAAGLIALVLFFLTGFLGHIPLATLGVVLIYSSWSMFSIRQIFSFRKRNHSAFTLALFTLIAVLLMGLINGIGFAVLLGLMQFLRTVFRPTDQLLGVDEQGMIHSMNNSNVDIDQVDGLMMYRFNSPLTYFNVAYFKKRVLQMVNTAPKRPAWVAIDATVSFINNDMSVFTTLNELVTELKIKGVTLILAGRRTELTRWVSENKIKRNDDDLIIVPDLYFAIRLIQSKQQSRVKAMEEALSQAEESRSGEKPQTV